MPVYASTSRFTEQRRHPTALMLIVGGHAALIAAVMTAKMIVPVLPKEPPIVVQPIPIPPDPPPNTEPPKQQERPQPPISMPYVPPPKVPTPIDNGPEVATIPNPILPNIGPTTGTNPDPAPPLVPAVVRTGPRWATPEWAVRPPYPDDKRRLEEEALLRLKLSIDERGRVVAVEPVGKADRSFLEAARRHVLAHWRYKPATEDGRPVASSTVVTLRFELES